MKIVVIGAARMPGRSLLATMIGKRELRARPIERLTRAGVGAPVASGNALSR